MSVTNSQRDPCQDAHAKLQSPSQDNYFSSWDWA